MADRREVIEDDALHGYVVLWVFLRYSSQQQCWAFAVTGTKSELERASQTVLFGAEFTRVFANVCGNEVIPKWEYSSQEKSPRTHLSFRTQLGQKVHLSWQRVVTSTCRTEIVAELASDVPNIRCRNSNTLLPPTLLADTLAI